MEHIGKNVGFISNGMLRYEGTIHLIDTAREEVTLRNVMCYGTEDRAMQNLRFVLPEKHELLLVPRENIFKMYYYEKIAALPFDPSVIELAPRPLDLFTPQKKAGRSITYHQESAIGEPFDPDLHDPSQKKYKTLNQS